jgi:hypothetical protein
MVQNAIRVADVKCQSETSRKSAKHPSTTGGVREATDATPRPQRQGKPEPSAEVLHDQEDQCCDNPQPHEETPFGVQEPSRVDRNCGQSKPCAAEAGAQGLKGLHIKLVRGIEDTRGS